MRALKNNMTIDYKVIVQGNNLKLANGFLGISSITLIECEGGPVLVDTGGYVTRPALLEGLLKAGYSPQDISLIFLTHMHFDHAHNIDLFPHAKFYVSQAEWNYVSNPHPDDLFVPWAIQHQLKQYDLEIIDGEGELVPGVEYFPTPGHTPGNYSLKMQVQNKGTVVIAGDAIKYPREVIEAKCDMAFDTIETGTASIKKILDIADRIVPGHFPELIKTERGFTWEQPADFHLLVR